MSFAELLSCGYIREIQQLLQAYIPSSIYELCHQFYFCIHTTIIYVGYDAVMDHTLRITSTRSYDVAKDDINKNTCFVVDRQNKILSRMKPESILCYVHDMKPPKECKIKTHCAAIIFGGSAKENRQCGAILLDGKLLNTLYDNKPQTKTIGSESMRLPIFPLNRIHATLLYDEINNSVISIGGQKVSSNIQSYGMEFLKNVHELKLVDCDNEKWKWNKLKKMKVNKSSASCTVINNTYFVCGGYNGKKGCLTSAEIYDYKASKWKKISSSYYSRCNAGIYNDRNNIVYVGGGHCGMITNGDKVNQRSIYAPQLVEYYNITKNKWYHDIPNTTNQHRKPAIWTQDNGILCIASPNQSNGVEYIDLRNNSKKWMQKEFSDLFRKVRPKGDGIFDFVCSYN